MLKNTLQKIKFSKDNLTMNLNIMPKLIITNIFLSINKMSNRKNDDPQ
jgi:hypothetical protein